MTDRLRGVFEGPPERSVVELLRAWWGIECPPATAGSPHPPILHQLWEAGAHRLAWGHQDILLPLRQVMASDQGYVEFFVENQSCWSAGYQPSGEPNPAVAVWVDGADGKDFLALGIDLHEFLARTLVIEAVFGSAWWTNGNLIAGNQTDRWQIWPELIIDPDRFKMPALYSDGNTLCFAFDPDGVASAFHGAATREELASSTFADLGTWFSPEQTSGPQFAPD